MNLLTKKQLELYLYGKIRYIREEKFESKYVKDRKYLKVLNHCHYREKYWGDAHSISSLNAIVPKKISVAFHDGYNYDYHFIIKELAKEF